jgi:hypothetical protein
LAKKEKTTPEPPARRHFRQWRIVLRYCVMEAIAIVGGLNFQTGTMPVYYPESSIVYSVGQVPIYFRLWDNSGALAAFVAAAAGVNLYFIRHQAPRTRVITTAIVVGVLLATALGMKAANL